MDVFINEIGDTIFKSTNSIWNELGLNNTWNIGVVSQLIKNKNFKTKEEWYDYYFKSGQTRLEKISSLSESDKTSLLQIRKKTIKHQHSNLNYDYGRTKQEIMNLGKILYEAIMEKGNTLNISLYQCQYIAFFRTVCETWNGIMIRELKTKEKIEEHFSNLGIYISLINVSGKFDSKYAVDFELYCDGEILCGIQIKPESYMNQKTGYIYKSHQLNLVKNKIYKDKFNRDVYYIYSSHEGNILNKEVLSEINNIIK